MHTFSRTTNQTLALLAVDNIYPSKAGLELFAAVDRGEMSAADAKESVKARARAYGSATTTVRRMRMK